MNQACTRSETVRALITDSYPEVSSNAVIDLIRRATGVNDTYVRANIRASVDDYKRIRAYTTFVAQASRSARLGT